VHVRHFFSFALIVTVYLTASAQLDIKTNSWAQVKEKKAGTIVLYWYESKPFIFKTPAGLSGIEYEIMRDFKSFLKDKYGYTLTIIWREAKNFGESYETVRDSKEPGLLGCSAFSITPERQKEIAFSPSYMPDICVLVTSDEVPIVQSSDEFNSVFDTLTAITIKHTTYEKELIALKEKANLRFRIKYIPSNENIIQTIADTERAFGFIDLPVYMMRFKENPSLKVKRQNLFPIKQLGYAFPLSKQSDWVKPLGEFFSSQTFLSKREAIIGKYIDRELFMLVEKLAIESNDLVLLLTKEKEIQYREILGKDDEIAKEGRMRNFLIAFVAIVLFFLGVIGWLYRKRSLQQRKIQLQQRSIEQKNKQLEKRNRHLVELDEEKNNLIKILAHDLRTPINHVQGLAQVFLLSNRALPDEQKMIIDRISDASTRLNKMISNILDVDSIENNRVKISKEQLSIASLVEKVVDSFDKEATRKNLKLKLHQQVNGSLVEVDPLFMTQILENLISNALKFSEKGKEVQVVTKENDEKIEISIRDSGPGLSETDKKLLFIKFQRLSAKPTDGENSTGLGLSIVKRYVELMGGTVWCESEQGKGATFTVSFPITAKVNRQA
jgi:signal transduction histidine kinase